MTIQKTGKEYKAMSVLGLLGMIVAAVVWALQQDSHGSEAVAKGAVVAGLLSAVMWWMARFGAWWNHS